MRVTALAALLLLPIAGCVAPGRREGTPEFVPEEKPPAKPEFAPEPAKEPPPRKGRPAKVRTKAEEEEGPLELQGRFTAFVWGPRYDGTITVDGTRGRHRGDPKGGGLGLRGDYFREKWRLEISSTTIHVADDLGIPDQSSGKFIDEDVDHSFQTYTLGGGACLWQDSWWKGKGAGKEGVYQGAEGARIDLVGGLWAERHATVQPGFANWPVSTKTETVTMPFGGLRAEWSPDPRVRVQVRGDMAGFNPGDRRVWRVEATAAFRTGKRVWLTAGWIWQDIDLHRGDPERFSVDGRLSGPLASIVIDL